MRKLSLCFAILAILLSNVMCAVVAYNYCELLWCGRYCGCSAPASTAFVYAIPFGIVIAVCALLAGIFHKKSKKQP